MQPPTQNAYSVNTRRRTSPPKKRKGPSRPASNNGKHRPGRAFTSQKQHENINLLFRHYRLFHTLSGCGLAGRRFFCGGLLRRNRLFRGRRFLRSRCFYDRRLFRNRGLLSSHRLLCSSRLLRGRCLCYGGFLRHGRLFRYGRFLCGSRLLRGRCFCCGRLLCNRFIRWGHEISPFTFPSTHIRP